MRGVSVSTVWGLLRGYQFGLPLLSPEILWGNSSQNIPMLASDLLYLHHACNADHRSNCAPLRLARNIARPDLAAEYGERFETLRTDEIKLARDVQTEQEHLDEFDKRKQAGVPGMASDFNQFL